MRFKVGTKLQIESMDCKVVGLIEYKNTMDNDKTWTEYRLDTNKGEYWLSVDDIYKEYSMSYPANGLNGRIGPEWHKVDSGRQVVVSRAGNVDVDYGESASFVEFEDSTEEKTLSVEMWDDGTEYSYGYYVEPEDILEIGYEQPPVQKGAGASKATLVAVIALIILVQVLPAITSYIKSNTTIKKYTEKSDHYTYITSITGNQGQKADVYQYYINDSTDNVAKNIINGIEGDTKYVTQKDDTTNDTIGILTEKEYCLIYHPEDDAQKVYIQVSDRKYNYTSDNAPYKSSASNTRWYRSHYYSTGYSSDSTSYSGTPSAYKTYSGDTIHNLGNGYFDSYSSSVRQSSINSRSSSSGGGK